MAGELSERQRVFVAEYVTDFNGAQAAIRAGYAEKSAKVTASRLLTQANVIAAVRQATESRVERLGLSQDMVVRALMAIAFTDLRDVARWDEEGNVFVIPSDKISDTAALALKEITLTRRIIPQKGADPIEVRELAVKMYDRQKALELLGKHLGMFREKVDVNVSGGLTLTALARMVQPEPEGQGELEA